MSQTLCRIEPFSIDRKELLVSIRDSKVERIYFTLISATKTIDQALWQNRLENRSWWDICLDLLKPAIEYFGQGNVGVQIYLGLGETEEQVMHMAQYLKDLGVTCLICPEVNLKRLNVLNQDYPVQKVSRGKFYRITVGNELISKGFARVEQFKFNEFEQILYLGIPYEDLLQSVEWSELFDPQNRRISDWEVAKYAQDFTQWFPKGEILKKPSNLLKEIFHIDFTEAWETKKRRIILEEIDFDEEEIEEEGGSFYKMVAELARDQEDEVN